MQTTVRTEWRSPCWQVGRLAVLTAAILVTAIFVAAAPLGVRTAAAQEPTGLDMAVAIEGALVNAIAQAEKSVVAIARVKRRDRADAASLEFRADPFGAPRLPLSQPRPGEPDFLPNEYGTGVIVDKLGLILTNFHVLGEDPESCDFYITAADRKPAQAKLVGGDPRSDLAVLSIDATGLTPIKFGDASQVRKGQIVMALGNPYAIARDGQVSASWGIIANFNRKAAPTPDDMQPSGFSKTSLPQFGTLIQTDAKLNLGTSGGALINLKGEMIGLTTSLAALPGYEQSAGYAIPVDDTFRRVVETLKQGREVEYGFLGVMPSNLEEVERRSGRHGARVANIVPGTPADRFGLQQEDVISEVDGRPVLDADGLVLQVGRLPADADVRLSVERNGRVMTKTVGLTKYAVKGKKIVTNPGPSWRGIRVDYFTVDREFVEHFRDVGLMPARPRLAGMVQGSVVITHVDEGSPAWNEGLRPEMAISHVGNLRIRSPKEFRAAVENKTGPVPIRLILPENEQPLRTIPPEPKAG